MIINRYIILITIMRLTRIYMYYTCSIRIRDRCNFSAMTFETVIIPQRAV